MHGNRDPQPILNDPAPLSLHDGEAENRLSGCLLLLLQAEMKPSSAGRRME